MTGPAYDVAVIGAGAAGLMAATESALRGTSVLLIEKNAKTGVKILMSGGTRCNLTHHADARTMIEAFGPAGRFLRHSVGAFPPSDVVRLFHQLGVPTKVESTGKVFPQSDRALHVRDALLRRAVESGVRIETSMPVRSIARSSGSDHQTTPLTPHWQIDTTRGEVRAARIIVTSGGRSWPGCGTTGDAYGWLSRLGHTLVPPRPALVPLTGGAAWMHDLSGVTLDDCEATVVSVEDQGGQARRPLARRRGSWLFTHFGFSGPAAMDISGVLTAAERFSDRNVLLDLVPDCDQAQLRSLLTDRLRDGGRQKVASLLGRWLPQRLAGSLATHSNADCLVAELSRQACHRLIENLKRLPANVTGTLGFEKAEVTTGGVALDEVDPRTMESRLLPGLYLAGEVLDVDGPIGGYNFQAAFSTGRAAGIAAAAAGKD